MPYGAVPLGCRGGRDGDICNEGFRDDNAPDCPTFTRGLVMKIDF
jgi:hypothetical protein